MTSRLIAAVIVVLVIATAGFLIGVAPPPAAAGGFASLHVPAGFRVELVTSPGLVSYPMMGTLDEGGRLFLCESSGNTLETGEMAAHPDYKIRLLEDTDGDGKFDRSSVFADHLTLPAGAVWYRNSLYVASPPDVLRFDGSTGARETLITGWTLLSNAPACTVPSSGPTDGFT